QKMKADRYCENRGDKDGSQPLVSEGSHSVKDADEVRKHVRLLRPLLDRRATVLGPEFCGNRIARPQHEQEMRANLLAVVGRAKLIDVLDRMLGKFVRPLE